MKFFALLVWVLFLSWLTQTAATPSWRAPTIKQALLPDSQALELDRWLPSKKTVTAEIDNAGALFVARPDNRWAAITRRVSFTPSEDTTAEDTEVEDTAGEHTTSNPRPDEDTTITLLRFQATLTTDTPYLDRVSLQPKPVMHLFLEYGERQYPFVARPMFFQWKVVVDTLIELRQQPEYLEIALIAAPDSNWRLSNVSVSTVHEHSRFDSSFSALIALWGLTLLWGVVIAWRRSKTPTLMVGLVVVLVLAGVLSSRTQVVMWFAFLSDEIRAVGGHITSGHLSVAMQSGHLLLFAALTFLALLFHRKWWMTPLKILSGIVVLAVATEALQNHAFGRSPDVQDLTFDLIGMSAGAALYIVVLILKRLLVRKRPIQS